MEKGPKCGSSSHYGWWWVEPRWQLSVNIHLLLNQPGHHIAVHYADGLVTPTLGSCVMSDLCLFRCLLNLDLQLLCLFTLIAQLACLDLFALVCLPWTSIGPAVLLPLNIKTMNRLSASVSLSTIWAHTNPLANTKFILNRTVMGHIHVWNL